MVIINKLGEDSLSKKLEKRVLKKSQYKPENEVRNKESMIYFKTNVELKRNDLEYDYEHKF